MEKEKRKYRKVATTTWADRKFRSLSKPKPNGQSLWIWLLTGPCTTPLPGLVMGSQAQLTARIELDYAWNREGFDRAMQEIVSHDMAQIGQGFVWLPNGIHQPQNRPESPNVVRHWGKEVWGDVPWCPLKDQVHTELTEFFQTFGKAFQEAFQEAFGKGLPEGQQLPFQEDLPLSFGKDPPLPLPESRTRTRTRTRTRQAPVRSSIAPKEEGNQGGTSSGRASAGDVSRETFLDPNPSQLVDACMEIAKERRGKTPVTKGMAKEMAELLKTRDPLTIKTVWTDFVVGRRKRTRITFRDFFDFYEEHERHFIESTEETPTP